MARKQANLPNLKEQHIASLIASRNFWYYHQKQLPNADLVLRRIGWDVGQLKEFILSDIQIQTTWGNTRLPFLSTTPWQIVAAENQKQTQLAAENFSADLANLDIHNIFEQWMDAVA